MNRLLACLVCSLAVAVCPAAATGRRNHGAVWLFGFRRTERRGTLP